MKSGGTTIQANEYDGLNRRIVRDETGGSGVLTHFYWNEDWQCVEERLGGSGSANKQYVWHPYYIDALAVSYDSGGVKTFTTHDASFNITAAINASGTVVERYQYSPYGEATILDNDFTLDSVGDDGLSDIGNEFLYTGRRLDPETGLYQFRNRYYHAQLGRFVGRDPIEYEGGLNLYEYAASDPLLHLDPLGQSPFSVLVKQIAKVGIKKGLKEFAEKEIKKRFVGQLTRKQMKELAEEIAEILESLDSAWWEICIEFIPAVGDLYGGGKLAIKAKEAWAKLKALEKKYADKVSEKLKKVDSPKQAPSTLKPGPYARESIPGHRGRPTAAEQRQVNELFDKHGCHTCGTDFPGTKSGNAIVDHQPAQALDDTTIFLPHCIDCAHRQAGEVTRAVIARQKGT